MLSLQARTCLSTLVLDLIRLGEGRWLARAVTHFDGEMVVLEEVLESDGLPRVEAVLDLDAEPAMLVIRHRDAPSHVLATRQLEMTDLSAPA
jgi:hypothetical protein